MKIFLSKKKLIKFIHNEKDLGFVPTMGALHKAHLSLIEKSNKLCNKTIVTIFVNKPQFTEKKDYQKYPRTLKKDIQLLKNSKIVDYLYLPTSSQIYKKKSNKKIKISALGKKLCGNLNLVILNLL